MDRERALVWYAVAGASLPAEALRFEHTYRSEYIGTPMRRRLGELGATGRTARRAALADGKVVGYTCIRTLPRQPSVEILAPLYLPEAAPYLPALIARAAREAAGSGRPLCRLHLADSRPEGWAAAEALGFRLERTWAYMYGEV